MKILKQIHFIQLKSKILWIIVIDEIVYHMGQLIRKEGIIYKAQST